MIHHPEYTLTRPPSCPTNQDHLILLRFNDCDDEVDYMAWSSELASIPLRAEYGKKILEGVTY